MIYSTEFQITCYAIALIAAVAGMFMELRRDLTMLQQNSYRIDRYRRWLKASGDTTSVVRLLAVAVVLVSMSSLSLPMVSMVLVFIISVVASVRLTAMRYKKPLVMTRRAWRIYAVMSAISLIVIAVSWVLFGKGSGVLAGQMVVAVTALALYCCSHIITMASVWLLEPVERSINARYRRDAARILTSMPDLKIIGITGSYGKTSTKHYLHRILSEKYDTLMTPGNFNTTLGVIRTIREHLKPYNEVFIVEMGAKQTGDIADICDLVHPQAGIITAVGPQHLESFKTIENVQATKFELADALPADGLAVLNQDFPYIANRQVGNVATERYTVNDAPGATWHVSDIEYGHDGTRFNLNGPDGYSISLRTRLVGECNISNLAAAVIMARHYGVEDDRIRYAVEQIEQVEHRLNLKRTPAGITIIDDAYNSNPAGSAMALDVLSGMRSGKRIVVTPGMVELGDRQYELNAAFGEKIAATADIAVIVNRANRDAIVEGALRGGMPESSIRKVESFAEAQSLLATLLETGDTVLYENDLPDTFK